MDFIIDKATAEKDFNRLCVAKKKKEQVTDLAIGEKIAVFLTMKDKIELFQTIMAELAADIESFDGSLCKAIFAADGDDEKIVFRAPNGKNFSPGKTSSEKFSFDAIKKAAKDPGEYELLPDEIKKPGLVSSAKIKALWKERRLGIYNDKCSCETKEVMKLKEI